MYARIRTGLQKAVDRNPNAKSQAAIFPDVCVATMVTSLDYSLCLRSDVNNQPECAACLRLVEVA